MYKAIESFGYDGVIYNVGDEYPKDGKVDKSKVKYLMSSINKIGKPLIEEIKETKTYETGGYDD